MLRFPGLESPWKRRRSWKTLEKSWNSKVLVLEILISGTNIIKCKDKIRCKMLCAIFYLLGQFGFQKHHRYCICLCNAVTPITDLCVHFLDCAMFVNRIYPGKSLKSSFVSPGKTWNLVFASPGKSWKTVFYCTNHVYILVLSSCDTDCLHCFQAVGWAAERTSSL